MYANICNYILGQTLLKFYNQILSLCRGGCSDYWLKDFSTNPLFDLLYCS